MQQAVTFADLLLYKRRLSQLDLVLQRLLSESLQLLQDDFSVGMSRLKRTLGLKVESALLVDETTNIGADGVDYFHLFLA